jgi:hypothetical protein
LNFEKSKMPNFENLKGFRNFCFEFSEIFEVNSVEVQVSLIGVNNVYSLIPQMLHRRPSRYIMAV